MEVDKPMEIVLYNALGHERARTIFDSSDFKLVQSIRWWCSHNGYCVGSFKQDDGSKKGVRMHRLIMGAKQGTIIDHINGNRLDNRKENLRFVTYSQNSQNTHSKNEKINNNTSKYFGVHALSIGGIHPWRSKIKSEFIGNFATEEEAAYAYDCHAREIFGPHARINGVPKPDNFNPAPKVAFHNAVFDDEGQRIPCLTILKRDSRQTRYQVKRVIDGKKYSKSFLDQDKAKEYCNSLHFIPSCPDPIHSPQRNDDNIAMLPCVAGCFVLVDDSTYSLYYAHGCSLSSDGYPRLTINGKPALLHRLVMNAPSGTLVDHIDRDKLNCQRANLRIVTGSENAHNRTKRKTAQSKFFGVFKQHNKFRVMIEKDGIRSWGGSYNEEDVAGWASDCLSRELFKEHARQNNVQLNDYVFINRRAVKIGDQYSRKKSQYHGVSVSKNRFHVRVSKNYREFYGGSYVEEDVAAWAADQLALEIHCGKYKKLNNIKLEGYLFHDQRAVKISSESSIKRLRVS